MPEFMLVKLDAGRFGDETSEEHVMDEMARLEHMLGDIGLFPSFPENVVDLVSDAGFEVEEGASEQYEKAKAAEERINERYDKWRNELLICMRNPDDQHALESIRTDALIDIAQALTTLVGLSR